jgi:hypothetical protein
MAIRRNLGGLGASLDPALGRFAVKDIAAALAAVLTVWGLRAWMTLPLTTSLDFFYLCIICGVGSLMYLCVLAVLHALPVTQIASLWPRTNGSQAGFE